MSSLREFKTASITGKCRDEGSDEVVRSYLAAVLDAMKGKCMTKLTGKKLGNLRRLAKLPDSPPDYVIGKFCRPKKTSVTIRLDADVLAWLKATGEGYQTRINTYPRQLIQTQR
jgi:hypothetical protein